MQKNCVINSITHDMEYFDLIKRLISRLIKMLVQIVRIIESQFTFATQIPIILRLLMH